ncbi:MAG: V-type ATP synthase subunit E [Gemmatimonadales bacterium]
MSIDALLLHLEEDAARESARLRDDAERRAAEIVARAEADAARKLALHLERTAEERRTAGERQIATARAVARERFLAVRAGALDRVFELGTRLLKDMPITRYADGAGALAVGAARYLERGPAVLLSPADAVSATAAAVLGLPDLVVESADVAAGVTGHSADGRVTVDNTLVAILARRRADLAIDLCARIEGH